MLLKLVMLLMQVFEGSKLLKLAKSKLGITVESVVLGALASCALAPFEIWPCMIIAMVFFMLLNSALKTKKAVFFTTLLFYASYAIFSLDWLNFVMEDFGQMPKALSQTVVIAFSIFYLALPYAIFNVIAYVAAGKKVAVHIFFFMPIAFIAADFYVTYMLTGFPWLIQGYACVLGPLKNYAPLIGVYGISALIYILSASIALSALRQFLYLPVAALILVIAILTEGISFTHQDEKSLKVLMVQGNIEQSVQNNGTSAGEIFNIYWDETLKHTNQKDLIIWPESAIPAIYEYQKDFFESLNQSFYDQKLNLVTGIFSKDQKDRKLYNAMIVFGNDNNLDSSPLYQKQALVPFGEVVPFGDFLRQFGSIFVIPNSSFDYGSKNQKALIVGDHVFLPSICYETIFASILRKLDSAEACGIILISNDSWFGPTKAPKQHLNIALMRVLELQKPMLRSTNSGISAYINEKGEVKKTLAQDVKASLEVDFTGWQGQTPYSRFGNLGVLIILALLLGFGIYARFKKEDELDSQINKLIRP